MVKNLLIIVLLGISLAYSNSAFTNGMSSTACTSANCNIANNCKCPSITNPGNFSLQDTPQFVTFTWDDAVEYSVNVNWFNSNDFWNGSILDTLGCRVKPTFYVTSKGTDFGYVNLLSKFGLIGDHSVNHNTDRSSTLAIFTSEINDSRDWI